MLNSTNPADTEFGRLLWEIVRRPKLPQCPLPGSKISPQNNTALVCQWQTVITNKNEKGNRKGLSLEDFVRLVNAFYGYSEGDDDCILNKSALHRLIQTGNPRIEGFAKSINTDVLKIVSEFSELTYEKLEMIGLQVLQETPNLYRPVPKKDKKLMPTEADQSQAVKGLILDYISKNGYKSLAKKGISEADILEILFESEPKVSLNVLGVLKSISGTETFLKLTMPLQNDQDYEDRQG
ncbi:hypothetical protein [Nostoc sp. UHCC 0870]|uniref:hypothetical protein n=1 Tax=Nostoc sp. UHCC 0870 TaxID=2914041 RepID=UPI001EDEF9CF|nr:hypothetical protein [Nostoc sp. UHCC 0870]UKO98299.1 hypothetical protein L6494_00665 [Nostoc sp. UHCC 0870]